MTTLFQLHASYNVKCDREILLNGDKVRIWGELDVAACLKCLEKLQKPQKFSVSIANSPAPNTDEKTNSQETNRRTWKKIRNSAVPRKVRGCIQKFRD